MREDLTTITNKKVYNELVKQFLKSQASQEKWIECYHFLKCASWSDIYKLPYQICRDTYTKCLLYKIIHLNCNYNLYIWKLINKSLCRRCMNVDTIEHYMFFCEKVKLFLEKCTKIVG